MRQFQTEAIILRRTHYGEADRILSLLTPNHGKPSAIAKGVRKQKSKLAGGLELFATCQVTISFSNKGEMGLIISARLERFYGNILHEFERMNLGYEFIKQINRTTETVTESAFYYLLRDSFGYLDNLSINYNLIELWFRLQFLSLLGRELNLVTATNGESLNAKETYNFDFTEMAFQTHSGGRFQAEHIKLLRLAQAKNPAVLGQVNGVEAVLGDCLWLVRAIDF